MSELSVMNAVNLANTNARGFVDLAKAQLADAHYHVVAVGYDSPEWTGITLPESMIIGARPEAPDIDPPVLSLPPDPENAPDLRDPTDIPTGDEPVNHYEAPLLVIPPSPSELPPAPGAPLINRNFTFPEPPPQLLTVLPPPLLPTRTEPTKIMLDPVAFEGAAPAPIPAPPSNLAALFAGQFSAQSDIMQNLARTYTDEWLNEVAPNHAAQMTALNDRLDELMQGGTGLNQSVENAIYERSKTKTNAEARRIQQAALSDMAARGFTLPTGALTSALQQARQAGADNNAQAARDIVVLQAELEQKNLQFAITTSAGLRTMIVNASAAYMQHVVSIFSQSTEYAKSVFANTVEIYNATVRYYSAQMELYKGQVSIYQAKISAAAAKVEIYKAEISALQALTQVDMAKVNMYKAQIDATSALIGVFRAQIDAVLGKVSLEKTKIEIFQAETQAFGAQAQAKNSEWNGFTAQMSGEESKARMFMSEVSAFNSEVEGYKARIEAKIGTARAQSETNQGRIANYNAKIQAYNARVSAESAKTQAHNENNRMEITAFEKEISAFNMETQAELIEYKALMEARVENATRDLAAQIDKARAKTEYGAHLASLSNTGAQVFGQLASAAMSGMNTLASDQYVVNA